MRLTEYFIPILKETPAEAKIISHKFMLRSGMVKQSSAGIYSWLPLGLKVLKNVEAIVIEEQNRVGHIPMLMPTIQSADLWRESGRYEDYGKEMLRFSDRHNRDMLYGPTNEELITDIFRSYIKSYKELPKTFYHIQWKFRDEIRPRYGVMRGREFFMKDGYSFDLSKEMAIHAYNRHLVSYLKTYERMGLRAIPMRAETGPIGGDHSHEFLVLAETGESKVFYDRGVEVQCLGNRSINYDNVVEVEKIVDEFTSFYARTEETHDELIFNSVPKEDRVEARGIEVGQIFYFGTKYSDAMGANVTMPDGSQKAVEMGSHGIGVSRLVGAIIEANHDSDGIIWPEAIAPFDIAIVNLKQGDQETDHACETIYQHLLENGLEPLYDDRQERAGVKFASMDLIGIPWRITVGPRSLEKDLVELKNRRTRETQNVRLDAILSRCLDIYAKFK